MRSLSPFLVLASLLGLLVVAGCDSNEPVPVGGEAVAPFSEGDVLRYRLVTTTTPIGFNTSTDTTSVQDLVVRVTRTGVSLDSVSNPAGVDVSDLVEVAVYGANRPDDRELTWYRQSPDSLVEVAYQSSGSAPSGLPAAKTTGRLAGLDPLVRYALRHAGSDLSGKTSPPKASHTGVQVREDPRVVYVRPLTQGQSWTSFEAPFLQTRTVLGTTTVTTPAGRFPCVRIEAFSPRHDLRYRTCAAEEGLVRHVLRDTIELRDEDGTVAGDAETTLSLRLTGLSSN